MKEHNKMLGVWISVSCFGSTPLKFFVGLGVQAIPVKNLQENRNLVSFYPLGVSFMNFYCNLLCLIRNQG